METQEKVVATQEFRVGQIDDILIHKREFKGKWYVDVRKYFVDAKTNKEIPTGKGITFRLDQLTPIINLLERVEATELGVKNEQPA